MVLKKSIKNAVAIAIICMIVVCSIATTARASSNSGQTHISYYVAESAAFPLTVTAEGNGYVQHGTEKISSTTVSFSLKVDEDMVFQIHPDVGEAVEEITLNGKNITDQMQDFELTVHGAEKKQELKVRFSLAPATDPETQPEETTAPTQGGSETPDAGQMPGSGGGQKPGGNAQTPITGDNSHVIAYVTLGTTSLLGMLLIIIKKESKKENKRGMI